MKRIMTVTIALALLLVMTVGLVGCGGDTSTSGTAVSLVDVTTDKGISLKLPSDMVLQESGAYANMETGASCSFGVGDTGGKLLSDWKEENVLATYQSKYDNVALVSFQNGLQINGKEAMVSQLTLTTPNGNALTSTLVIVTDGTKNYVVTFNYGSDKTDGALAQNLQACIDSITIQ